MAILTLLTDDESTRLCMLKKTTSSLLRQLVFTLSFILASIKPDKTICKIKKKDRVEKPKAS